MTAAAHPALPRSQGRSRLVPRVTVRGVRLASGLVLLAYVLSHLVNHALGNVSLAAMETGLDWVGWVWWQPWAQPLLYGAFAVHLLLGLWALYHRRPFRYRLAEGLQLGLGLLVPLMLLQHIVATRGASELDGVDKGYAQLLYKYFVQAPEFGLLQAATIVVVWVHGCLGLYLWLRLKPWFPRVAPWFLAVAVLVPVLALLGFAQGGRSFLALYADPAWRAANLGPDRTGTAAQNLRLAQIRDGLTLGYAGLVGLVLMARGWRRLREVRRGLHVFAYPDGRLVKVPDGTSVLEASRIARIPHASVCGGRGRCSTCRVRIVRPTSGLSGASSAEQAVLDRIGAGPTVRLACQLRPHCDIVVAPLMAPSASLADLRRTDAASFGEERFIVAMFVDMRGSTRLAERRLPFDTVFLINRFLEAVSQGVEAAGGTPNQFLGDGLMALFGLRTGPQAAARQALEAVRLVAENVERLNRLMADSLDEPIRYGIGLHAGTAILGFIGDRQGGRAVFTAIGDPVNVASRLQGMTKRFRVEALVSDTVFEEAGMIPDLPREETPIEGRDGQLAVRLLAKAGQPWRERAPA